MYPTPAPLPCQQGRGRGRGTGVNSPVLAPEFESSPDSYRDALGFKPVIKTHHCRSIVFYIIPLIQYSEILFPAQDRMNIPQLENRIEQVVMYHDSVRLGLGRVCSTHYPYQFRQAHTNHLQLIWMDTCSSSRKKKPERGR